MAEEEAGRGHHSWVGEAEEGLAPPSWAAGEEEAGAQRVHWRLGGCWGDLQSRSPQC